VRILLLLLTAVGAADSALAASATCLPQIMIKKGRYLPRTVQGARFWHRFEIRRIEDLGNAVLGAELEAVQMAGPPIRGSLAFAARDGVIFSSGLINGNIAVSGPLSQEAITLAVGLRFGPGSRHWLNAVSEGDVGIFLPGDEHDALYTSGSLYVTATLSAKRLREEAAREGLVLDRGMTSRTGLHSRPISARSLVWLRSRVARIHDSGAALGEDQHKVGCAMLRAVIEHYASMPDGGEGRIRPAGRARIVHRAREFIRENLAAPISLDAIAAAAGTSRRTLSRAFHEILEDTPGTYVRRLRLHRIRRELVSKAAAGCTVSISMIAASWGIREPGRMSGWYRELFGERPSETLATYLAHQRPNMGVL
jgi:AraC-like DNA-binding protein